MGAPALDARDLVERLWQEARERQVSNESRIGQLERVDTLAHTDELRYLNARWRLDVPNHLPPSGARWKHWAKERVANLVLHLLHRYFVDEQDFLAHVVRFENKVAAAHDQLVDELRLLLDQIRDESRRLVDRDEMLHGLLEARVERLEYEVAART